jgi:hypothetical protein
MADLVSLVGILLTLPPVVAAVITIASDIREARKDMQNLAGDLFTIKGVLEYVKSVRDTSSNPDVYQYDGAQFEHLLYDAGSILDALKQSLQIGDSVIIKKWRSVAWHFKKKKVLQLRHRLEHLKGSMMMVMMGNNMYVPSSVHCYYRLPTGIIPIPRRKCY